MKFSSIRVAPQTRSRELKRAGRGLVRAVKSLIVNFKAGRWFIDGEIYARGEAWIGSQYGATENAKAYQPAEEVIP